MRFAINGKEFEVQDGGLVNVLNGTPLEIREEGPITLFWDGKRRQERTPPFYVGGDNGAPLPWSPGGGDHTLSVIQGPGQAITDVTVKVTDPIRWEKIGPGDTDGPTNKSLGNFWITGRNQNINISAPGDYLVEGTVSELAWDDRPTTPGAVTPSMFRGQGVYAQGRNRLVFRFCYFRENGWPGVDGRGLLRPKQRDIFHHGAYINGVDDKYPGSGFDVLFDRCYFDRNCAMGAKVMRDARFTGCLMHANAIGVQAIYGRCLIEGSTFYRGAYNWNGDSTWFGNGIGDLYCPTEIRNSLVVAGPLDVPATGDKVMNNGVVKVNREHGQYDVPGGKLAILNTTVRGWAGPLVGGDNNKPGNVTGAFTVDSRGPIDLVLPDPRLELVAGSSVRDVVERHTVLVRDAAARA